MTGSSGLRLLTRSRPVAPILELTLDKPDPSIGVVLTSGGQDDASGVVVTEIHAGAAAADILQVGDRITAVNGVAAKGAKATSMLVREAVGQVILSVARPYDPLYESSLAAPVPGRLVAEGTTCDDSACEEGQPRVDPMSPVSITDKLAPWVCQGTVVGDLVITRLDD